MSSVDFYTLCQNAEHTLICGFQENIFSYFETPLVLLLLSSSLHSSEKNYPI